MKKKRILSVILTLCMLIGLLPSIVLAVESTGAETNGSNTVVETEESQESGEELLASLMNMITTSTPEGFDDDKSTPYGTSEDEIFTLLEKAEVFSFISSNGTVFEAKFTDDLKKTSFTQSVGSATYGGDYVTGTSASLTDSTELSALRFAQGVAFDPTGCGRRNYVAIVGYCNDSETDSNGNATGSVYLFIINADAKQIVCKHALRSNDVKLRSVIDQLTVVDSPNFFSITAGDYKDKGKDTLVVYTGCVNSTTDTGLYEVTYESLKCTQTVIGTGTGSGSDSLLNSYFMSNTDDVMSSTKLRNQLTVDLATGDFDNNGVDDLLVLSGLNHPDKCHSACIPQLRIRGLGTRMLLLGSYSIGGYESNNKYCSITSGSVSVGDLDGDGKSKVVVAGFYTEVGKLTDHSVKDHNIGYAVLDESDKNGSISVKKLSNGNVSGVSQGDSLRENEYAIQQFSVECIAFNGIGTKEYVFLNGFLYQLDSSDNLALIESGQMSDSGTNILHTAVTSYNGSDIDEVFVYSTSVGNVMASNEGREAILITVGYKTHTNKNSDSTDKEGSYYFSKMIIYSDSSGINFDYFQKYDVTKGSGNATSCVNGAGANGINCLLIAVDYGDDSVVAKYSQKAYTYTDPAPVAFLQAAPYFEEFDPGNSSTTYSYSESYSYMSGTTKEYTYDIGFTSEIETSAIKTSFDAGNSYELSEEFTKTMDTTYTTTFEANDKNQVIIRQTVVYYYLYDVMTGVDDNGEPTWTENSYVISVPKYPVLTSLTVEQYNALASAYNSKVTELKNQKDPDVDASYKLPTISSEQIKKYYLNNEGNPYNYAGSASDYSKGYDMYKENGSSVWMSLSHAGGTAAQACTVSLTTEQSTTTSEGMYVNMSVMVGAEAFGVGAYGGISAGYSRMTGHTYSTAIMTEKETAGAVQNLNAGDPASYSFMWKLIGWSDSSFLSGVPCIGYAVTKVSSLLQPVSDLEAKYSYKDEQVTLTWKTPETANGRGNIDGFKVYMDGEYLTWVDNAGAGKDNSCVIDVSELDCVQVVFTVVSASKSNEKLNSMHSNEAVCFFILTAKETVEKINQTLDELEETYGNLANLIAQGDKANAEALSKAIEELTAAYKAADELLKAYADEQDNAIHERITALEEAMNGADKALQAAVDLVQKNLDDAIVELKAAIAAGDEKNAAALTQTVEVLTAAYQTADALLKSENDSQQAQLDELKELVAEQNAKLESEIEALNGVNEEQSESLSTARTIAIVGLVIAAISLICNIVLISQEVSRRKKSHIA